MRRESASSWRPAENAEKMSCSRAAVLTEDATRPTMSLTVLTVRSLAASVRRVILETLTENVFHGNRVPRQNELKNRF